MLCLVDSFPDRLLAFLWEQTVPHYWLTCFSIPTRMSFWINSSRTAKESLPESSVSHIVILMTLSLSVIKDSYKEFISDIYPIELYISETTESASVASYLDLPFTRDENNNVITKLYEKRDVWFPHC